MPVSARFKHAVRSYRYSSPTRSLMERLCLVRFWDWATNYLPRRIAPNVLTLMGFASAVTAWILLMVEAPTLGGKFSVQWYPLSAFLLFVYQTMDGCDGPQARRLGCGSALGELVDHGIDSLVVTIVALFILEVCGISLQQSVVLFAIVGSHLAFMLSNMTLLHLGKQFFNDIDCQEAQIGIQLMLLATWTYFMCFSSEEIDYQNGHSLGGYKVPVPEFIAVPLEMLPSAAAFHTTNASTGQHYFELRWLFIAVGAIASTGRNVAALFYLISCHYIGLAADKKSMDTTDGGAIDVWIFLQQTLRCFIWTVLVALSWWVIKDLENAYVWPLWTIVVTFGFGSFALNSLVIRVTKQQLPSLMMTPAFQIISAWCTAAYFSHDRSKMAVLTFIAAVSVMHMVLYARQVASNIATVLNIPFWTVPRPRSK